MRKLGLLLLIAPAMMIFSSCAKPVTHTCAVTKVFYLGNLGYRFSYTNGSLAEIEMLNPNGTMAEYHTLTRNAQGLLYQMDWIEFGLLLERKVVIYNANNQPSTMYSLDDLNNDGYPEQINYYYKYVYDANNHLIEVRHYNSVSTYQGSETFVWSGNNLTRYNTLSGDYYVYTYDSNKSIYGSLQWEYFILNEYPSVLSENNLLQSDHYNSGNVLQSSNNNSYGYNADGYPESGTLQGISYLYEYNCVED